MKVDYKQWWDNLHEDIQQQHLNKFYPEYIERGIVDVTLDMIKVMYLETSNAIKWWQELSYSEANRIYNKYFHNVPDRNITNTMINMMFEAEHRDSKLSPTITNNSDKLSFIAQMKDIPLEERYDYVSAVLLTCPISVDDLSEIFNLLSGSLRKYKERNKK